MRQSHELSMYFVVDTLISTREILIGCELGRFPNILQYTKDTDLLSRKNSQKCSLFISDGLLSVRCPQGRSRYFTIFVQFYRN
jgi:hypothetical protein